VVSIVGGLEPWKWNTLVEMNLKLLGYEAFKEFEKNGKVRNCVIQLHILGDKSSLLLSNLRPGCVIVYVRIWCYESVDSVASYKFSCILIARYIDAG